MLKPTFVGQVIVFGVAAAKVEEDVQRIIAEKAANEKAAAAKEVADKEAQRVAEELKKAEADATAAAPVVNKKKKIAKK